MMVTFATLPGAIFHARRVETYAVKILHVRPRGDLAPSCAAASIFDLSTPAACDLVQLPTGTARSNAIECGMWLIHKPPRFSALVEHVAPSLRIPMAPPPHAAGQIFGVVPTHCRSLPEPPPLTGLKTVFAVQWSMKQHSGSAPSTTRIYTSTPSLRTYVPYPSTRHMPLCLRPLPNPRLGGMTPPS